MKKRYDKERKLQRSERREWNSKKTVINRREEVSEPEKR